MPAAADVRNKLIMITPILDRSFRDGSVLTRLLVADVRHIEHDEAWIAEAIGTLSAERRDRALTYTFPRGRALSVTAAQLLDMLIQPYGLRESQMTYSIGEHGRPSFASCHTQHVPDIDDILTRMDFSISHSGTRAAVALAVADVGDGQQIITPRIGLDIQMPTRSRQSLFRTVLAPDELRQMAALGHDEQDRLFQRLWTHKEAYAKAIGTGLQHPYPSPPPEAIMHEVDIDDYHLCIIINPS